MKNSLITLFLLLFSLNIFAVKQVGYKSEQIIIRETEADKQFQYNYIKTWIYDTFRHLGKRHTLAGQIDYNKINILEVVDENPEIGRVTFVLRNAIFRTITSNSVLNKFYVVDLICRVDVKDNKVRFRYSDIIIKLYTIDGSPPRLYEKSVKEIPHYVKEDFDKILMDSVDKYLALLKAEANSEW